MNAAVEVKAHDVGPGQMFVAIDKHEFAFAVLVVTADYDGAKDCMVFNVLQSTAGGCSGACFQAVINTPAGTTLTVAAAANH